MRRSIIVLACVLTGCSTYQPVDWGNGVAWEQARNVSRAQIRQLADAVAIGHEQQTNQKRASEQRTSGQAAVPSASEPKTENRRIAGSPITIPDSGRHVVMPGETLTSIASRYGLGLNQIASINRMARPHTIFTGQEIWLKPKPQVPEAYQVASGDTFLGIAHRYGLRYDDMRSQNPSIDPESLLIGQTLFLAKTKRAAPPITTQVAKLEAATKAELPNRSSGGFLWPVQGDIVEGFGAKPSGIRNDGINIGAAMGATVLAAEAGVVVYAGEAVPAMGRMLMIRHADEFVTAYGHNQTLLVTVGDSVERGQAIAKVGNTGTVTEAQLHFQIRKGKEAIDPVELLRGSGTRLASTN